MRVTHWITAVLIASTVGSVTVAAAVKKAAAPAEEKGEARLEEVADRSLVCMVNDRYFARPQIPVEVEGKKYYGCCAMCKERLANDTAARNGTDPISGKSVDKASAVIGRASDDTVLYFETLANLKKYNMQR